MARTHSQEHRQAARETWKRKLSALAGQGGGSKISHQQLSMLLTVEFGQAPPAAAKLLREAAGELEAALAKGGEGSMEALDVWIDARLLTSGPKLLIADAGRRKVFEQQRERKRRQNTTDHGKRSATITMPQAAWNQLVQLKQELEQSSSKTVTLGDAVSTLLTDRIESARPASKKKKRVDTPLEESSGKKALTRQLDLLKQIPRFIAAGLMALSFYQSQTLHDRHGVPQFG